MKATPKSCSCRMCKLSKSMKPCKKAMKREERAFRHSAKVDLNLGKDVDAAPHGDRQG